MVSHIVTCPICKKKYKLTTEHPDTLPEQEFRCPKCFYRSPMHKVIPSLPAPKPQKTTVAPPPQQTATPVKTKRWTDTQKPRFFLNIQGAGVRIPVNEGLYTIGRRSPDSTANIQLTPDPYMSRVHAKIASKVINGKLVVQVCSLKENNPILINGQVCPVGQARNLKPNDCIQLGTTKVVVTM